MGSNIRHAGPTLPSILPLPVAMVQSSLGALLMAAIGGTSLLPAGRIATLGTAIALPAITVAADPEDRVATRATADALPEYYFAMSCHPPGQVA